MSCDGPNAEGISTSVSARGVHNDDGFQAVLKVNNGASITPDLVVAIQLSAVGADEMYITQESSCTVGGIWEPFRVFKQWTLHNANSVNFFYVKFRNSQRESDCVFASIEHDSVAPTLVLNTPVDGSTVVNSAVLELVGACSEDALITIKVNSLASYTTSCVSRAWTKSIDITALPRGSFTIQLKAIDQVMNASSAQNFIYIK